MIKILVLEHWYSLSDQKMELELANNLSFMNFLGYPETIPDYSTYGSFSIVLRRETVLTQSGRKFKGSLKPRD
jgi:IS5 family transposase